MAEAAARLRRCDYLVWLALPLLFYLIPLAQGYAWNAIGMSVNVLNPPEGYVGRSPGPRITVEAWGASVVIVPLHARTRDYLLAGELPLWNPYQGLGQPFAAQGEGSPYFPLEILRALLPYSFGNLVTVAMVYVSAVCLYLFLLGVGASRPAALFGAMVWPLTGAIGFHLARPNIAEQVSMAPVLFWAMAAAIRERTLERHIVLAVISGLHLLAGFIQIAMLSGLLAVTFGAFYAWLCGPTWRSRIGVGAPALGAFALGSGLAAFSLLPMLEAMRISFSKNLPMLGFLVPIAEANLLAFFMPYAFGIPLHRSWIHGTYPNTIDWENLYAISGLLAGLAAAVVVPTMLREAGRARAMFLFFGGAFVLLTLRYVSAAPGAALNLLPILDRQSPKHATGMMVLCLVIAAAFAIDVLPRASRRHARIIAGCLLVYAVTLALTIVGKLGGFQTIGPAELMRVSLMMTVAAVALGIAALELCVGRGSPARPATILGGAALAEASLYIPLGNASARFLAARVALAMLIAGATLLLASRRVRPAAGLIGLIAVGYAAMIAWPPEGLPHRADLDDPPRFMRWLAATTGPDDRTFGIMPDGSGIAKLRDLSVVGPLAPPEFVEYVRLLGDERAASEYGVGTHFMLAGGGHYDLNHYAIGRPVLDWAGVRHIVLDRSYFSPVERQDHLALLSDPSLRVAYEDDRVMIVESLLADGRAELWSSYVVEDDRATILASIRDERSRIGGVPRIETASPSLNAPPPADVPTRTLIPRSAAGPNAVQMTFDAPSGGLLVVKDVYAPGWHATLNGRDVPIVRVNGIVRGVFVPEAGPYELRMVYRPASFDRGVAISLSIAGFLVVLCLVVRAPRGAAPQWLAAGDGSPATGGSRGSQSVNVLPTPTALVTRISPPSRRVASRTSDNPRPVPRS